MDFSDIRQEYLCKNCQTRYIDRTTERHNECLCKECRQELTKLRIPKKYIVFMAIIVALLVVAMIGNVGIAIDERKQVLENKQYYEERVEDEEKGRSVVEEANVLFSEGKASSAINFLNEYIEANPENIYVTYQAVVKAMKYGFYDMAMYWNYNYMLDKMFYEDELDELDDLYDDYLCYANACDKIQQVFNDIDSQVTDESTDEEIAKIREKAKADLISASNDYEYEGRILKFYAYLYFAEDEDEFYDVIKETYKYAPITPIACAYGARLCRSKGQIDEALEWINRGSIINSENYDLLRTKATIMLVNNQPAEAMAIMDELISKYPEGEFVTETYCTALIANGRKSEVAEIVKSMEESGYAFSDDFYNLCNDIITIREYYVEEEE